MKKINITLIICVIAAIVIIILSVILDYKLCRTMSEEEYYKYSEKHFTKNITRQIFCDSLYFGLNEGVKLK